MPNLLVCMTPGVGLATWKRIGSINRELMPYREYVRKGWKVKLLTYDTEDFPARYEDFDIVKIPFSKPYLFALPWLKRDAGKWADLVKTSQSTMAQYYTAAANRWKKPILLRCGYVHGESLEVTQGRSPKTLRYQRKEARAFRAATHCQVPTTELADWVRTNYAVSGEKISIVPNFVDTDIFRPTEECEKMPFSVISVGRLSPVKQFDLLIEACSGIETCRLTIVGEGSERGKLMELAREKNVDLDLPGNIANERLPSVLSRHLVFALPSKWEGHPKALIEAMACGMACVGANSRGIFNVMEHGRNGLLTEANPRELRSALLSLLNDGDLRKSLEGAAREFVKKNYAFQVVIDKELSIAESLVKR